MINALTGFLATKLPTLSPLVSTLVSQIPVRILPEVIAKVAEILISIGKEVLLCKDSFDELGYKAINAEMKPDDFSSKTEYLRYLNDSVDFNQADFDSLSESEKMELKIAGTLIYSMALNEHLSVTISPETLAAFSILGLEPKNILDVCDRLLSIGEITTKLIDKTFSGTGSSAEIDTGMAILKEALFGNDTET
jgi:hypothetical protein